MDKAVQFNSFDVLSTCYPENFQSLWLITPSAWDDFFLRFDADDELPCFLKTDVSCIIAGGDWTLQEYIQLRIYMHNTVATLIR